MNKFILRALGFMKAHPLYLGALAITILLQLAYKIGAAFCFQRVFDDGIRDRNGEALYMALIALAILLVTSSVSALIQHRIMSQFGSVIGNRLRQQLFDKLLAISPDHHQQNPPSNFVDLMGGHIDNFVTALVRGVAGAILDFLIIATAIAALFWIEWRLALMVLAAVPFTMMAARPFQRRANEQAKNAGVVNTEVLELTQDTAVGHTPLLIFHAQRRIAARFAAILENLGRMATLYHFHTGAAGTAAQTAAGITQLLVIGVGGWLAYNGFMTGGLLVAFVGLLINVSDAVSRIAAISPIVSRGAESLARIDQLLALADFFADPPDAKHIDGFHRELRFEHVSFSYPGGKQILDDVSFTVPANSSVALVGPSGSGKSTVLSLLMRIQRPTEGQIFIDGQPLSGLSEASLRSVITAVPQMPALFRGTIRENIEVAHVGISNERVEAAARAAAIHDAISEMPQAYDTQVGDGGSNLSGGQRQRVAIARAFAREAPILLLDEATSALDSRSRGLVGRSIGALRGTNTIVEVTHRVSGLDHFDQILVFDKGSLVQSGTHARLLAEGGLYKELYLRLDGLEWDEKADTYTITPDGLRRFSFFADCSAATLGKLAESFMPERFAEHRVIFQERDPGERFYIIVQGTVDVLQNDPVTGSRRIATLKDGDYFGEMALVRDIPRTATVRTLTECAFLTLHRNSFLALLEEEPSIRSRVVSEIERRGRALDQ
jgi:ATP-binding cassette subfamily B protein